MHRRLLPLLGVAFVVALVATGIFYGLIAGRLNRVSSAKSGPLVVAARNLEPGRVLEAADLKVAPWAGAVPKGSFSSPQPVVGMTVLQEIEQDEPVTGARVASAEGTGGASLGIPVGLRAVSIQAPDSPGVLQMLRPGNRVDIQVVRTRGGPRGGEAELRTLLQDVPVLFVSENSQGRNNAGVLTVLANASDAELLGLADAGARLRVVLRNPLDKETAALPGGDVEYLFRGPRTPRPVSAAVSPPSRPKATAPRRPAAPQAAAAPPRRELQLSVRMASVTPATLAQLGAQLVSALPINQLQVSPFRPGWDLEATVHELVNSRSLEILSASSLRAGDNRPVSVEAATRAAAPCAVQVLFRPGLLPNGRVRLRVEPQITAPHSSAATMHRMETEVEIAEGQSLLITGFDLAPSGACGLERLFPEAIDPANRALVVLITPQFVGPAGGNTQTTAAARPVR
jgi:Flp pilus assembly protein CpaB